MGNTLTQKILAAHLGKGRLSPGEEIGIRIDQTLTQDATGTMAYLQFEAMGLKDVKTDLSVSYVDHNTIQVGFENADDHCPMFLGVKAVLARSFERIHAANLINFGVAPLVFDDPAGYDALKAGDPLEAPAFAEELQTGLVNFRNPATNGQIRCRASLSGGNWRLCWRAGC
ncbi:MAG: hypothetical protein C4523_01315 [Myxococcales bacterium]|nr:MAG: hypothetical protein C4523_01315 [Myxococcales bacterium]